MTAMSNIVRTLDYPDAMSDIFPDHYRELLIKDISSRTIEYCKRIVDEFIKKNLKDSIFSYKLYAYKSIEDIIVEILIKPIETANILEYHLRISKEECRLVKVR